MEYIIVREALVNCRFREKNRVRNCSHLTCALVGDLTRANLKGSGRKQIFIDNIIPEIFYLDTLAYTERAGARF